MHCSLAIKKIKVLPNYMLEVEFNDGTHGSVEMSALITSKRAGVFSGA